MGVLDKIKKKVPGQKEEKREERSPTKKKPQARGTGFEAHRVLVGPIVTEKSTKLARKENQYTFEVKRKSNKHQIKKAIEDVYNVRVVNVRTINIPRKKRRLGRTTGWKKGYKKAIVTIKKGQKIEFTTA